MGKIFCLMGKSASGKDSIYNRISQREELGLRSVIPYTTRPIRSGEVDGESYHFRTEEQVQQLEAEGRIIELRAYNTVHGVWKYFTADDGQIDLDEASYLMIGTLEAYTKIRDYFGSDCVIPLYIWVDDGVRLERALGRERAQAEPKYAEMCRRFLADEQDFSEDKIQAARIERRFENTTPEEVDAKLVCYIKEMMQA